MVRPLVNLLALDCSLLQNFEALMALTNLAGISDRLRLVQLLYENTDRPLEMSFKIKVKERELICFGL